MLIRWIILGSLIVASAVFAEENIDPPLSPVDCNVRIDSLSPDVSAYIDSPLVKSQMTLVDWLKVGLFSSKPTRVVIKGMFDQQESPATEKQPEGVLIPWESSVVLYQRNGAKVDSFLVRASNTGRPGTEVGPSVAVSFATPWGWTCPPIRFGPVCSNTICPLGKNVELKILEKQEAGPVVRLVRHEKVLGSR